MLTYLFRAHFTDGSVFDQTQDDTARLSHPRKGTGSSFTDLLWLLEHGGRHRKGKTLAAFELRKPKARKPFAAVHLDTGRFEVNGIDFSVSEDDLETASSTERRLIYYRLVTRHRSADFDNTGAQFSEWRERVETRFVIGWQATLDGRNVQRTIGLDG
jgi:hypothetical protein